MRIAALVLLFAGMTVQAQSIETEKLASEVEERVIEWRRDFHEHPELSNREFETSKKVATFLESLGMEVQTGVAHTGVVGILRGGKPGPVVALRADMDALPVTEKIQLPFASKVKSTYNGIETGVMHACGHDTHMAILMGTAEILSKIKKELKGTVKFIFQPAEEGAPSDEEGGAEMMVKEGVLKNPDVDVIFGLHISSDTDVGTIEYRPRGIMAASQRFIIKIHGRQSHGSRPWTGIDPVFISTQVIAGLNGIISRDTELTKEAAVISVGVIRGGLRYNIIPEEVELIGTIRTLDDEMQKKLNEMMIFRVKAIAESYGGTADISIDQGNPITYNDPELMARMLPSLEYSAGKENVNLIQAMTIAEDFAFYQQEVPGMYFQIGGKAPDIKREDAPNHHTPDFYIDEKGLKLGVISMINLTLDYMGVKHK